MILIVCHVVLFLVSAGGTRGATRTADPVLLLVGLAIFQFSTILNNYKRINLILNEE